MDAFVHNTMWHGPEGQIKIMKQTSSYHTEQLEAHFLVPNYSAGDHERLDVSLRVMFLTRPVVELAARRSSTDSCSQGPNSLAQPCDYALTLLRSLTTVVLVGHATSPGLQG